MKFETLKTGKFATKKQIIIGSTAVVVVLVATLTFFHSFAKYQVTQNLKLAEGTVNYKAPDLNMVAVYQGVGNSDTDYTAVETVPTSGYTLNNTRSYCAVGGTKDATIGIAYAGGKVTISNLVRKGTKCYLYFDTIKDTTKPTISNVTTSVTKTEINVTVTASDNTGVTEYWYQLNSNAPVKGTGNTYKFTGLTAGTTYSVKVYVKDAAGNQSDTTTKSVQTTPNGQTSDTILAGITVKTGTPTFTNAATTDEGVYKVSDGMYGGYSYYWRGAVTNNYVKFAGKCWRIIRINGDGSMRLIYDGTTCHANGTSTTDSLAVSGQAYNSNYNRSEYVGYTYTTGSQRTTSGTASNLKTQNETWYNSNLASYASKIADGKYCNDRNTGSGYSWSSQPSSTFYYAGYDRSGAKSASSVSPTLSCPSGDVYTLKVGAITMDEVVMAGGKWGTANNAYYLYNGNYYWTMSPFYWYSPYACVFYVRSSGNLNNNNVHWTAPGVRPVINLKADTLFATGGNGTQSNPYVVS